ncbi:MAG TPA: DUF362 domain-containing protein [Bryobacteraceae bacterium]|jgi:uncharacterized protein (DUF362 family)|nr:DUF362 domain-containing protein [Bryobacteraceae bacterium]
MSGLNRREFLTGSAAGLVLAGCVRRKAVPCEKLVSVVRRPDYTQELYSDLRRILSEYRLDVRGKRVLLKPNLVEFEPGSPINTHPLLVHAALEAFRELGADVMIGEGPGHRRNTLDMAEAAGYFETIPKFEEIFTDLNLDRATEVRLAHPQSRLQSIYLAQSAMSCDLLVSMPKMKTHHWVGATLSMKNLFGTVSGGVYGWPKNILHWAGIPGCIADLYKTLPAHFAIVDGIVGMEGNGPIQGTAKRAGVVVAGRDLAAVDASCCQIMGIDPHKIEYLKLAVGDVQGLVGSIHQIGEPVESVRTRFDLLPEWSGLRQS